ncbi:hypothetical protein K431DRAFT_218646 [Polychaeton citri CBS 116435]|uniref:ABC transporter ATPase n=1 Tax=Polychaeton citri CBS 116435 TaxID=1314669 RepID=A0A9P4QD80_9PEZI|nr:hypothetical protein K431DRAFT_218646 [Polychaeton citri CBS 116435]
MAAHGRGGARGAYYKNLYGGGGRGRGRGRGRGGSFGGTTSQDIANYENGPSQHSASSRDWDQLGQDLGILDGQPYPAYKRLLGTYTHGIFKLSVDHVQGDAYAPPSRVRTIMQWSRTGLPARYLTTDIRKIAVCDYVTRVAADVIRQKHMDRNVQGGGGGWSGPKGGAFSINAPGQEVLPRTSAIIGSDNAIELRFTVALPAAGRTCLGQQARAILAVNLVELVQASLLYTNLDQAKLERHIVSVEKQHDLRRQLQTLGMVAFVANGSILPRVSGASQAPMTGPSVVPFKSPPELEIAIRLADGATVTGMGIAKGITLLTGGGFHGKSTLLEAIELGVYDHIPGDGRELVVSDPTAVKIRAEDGRSVSEVDISPFISTLPGGKGTRSFSTDDASGSTSMAANIQEALEAGCGSLLIDEDSSATNLLVRDARMQTLIKQEPITPLVSKVRALFNEYGVSTIMVLGGLGDWLTVADQVVAMDNYIPRTVTSEVDAILQRYPATVTQHDKYGSLAKRSLKVHLHSDKTPFPRSRNFIPLPPASRNPVANPAEEESGIDVSGLDQLVEIGQTRMIASCIHRVAESMPAGSSMEALLAAVEADISLDRTISPSLVGGELVAMRRFELSAAISRIRGLTVSS